MRKSNVSIPSYRHHKPSGQAVVTLNARDHYLGPWQSETSNTEYKRLIAEWMAARKTATAAGIESCASIRVAELLTGYLAEAQAAYTKGGEPTSHLHNITDALIPLRQALRSYTLDGPHGKLLDASHDTLGDSAQEHTPNWQAFEMEHLMESRSALLPACPA
jgi:type IV secretory pathway VirB4 component